jgi:2-oxo-4-hydroxy-4-carboxy-5-ureidoimidazoline decarboxylase
MDVGEFNALPDDAATGLVSGCLGVPRWVRDVVVGRPYADRAALLKTAHDAALHLSDDELAAALSRHPRIGERPAGSDHDSRHSRTEQSGIDDADGDRLRDGNAAYEARFGHVFLIRAAGRTSGDVLAELDRRLGNDAATEREETVTALRDIALLRLDGTLG